MAGTSLSKQEKKDVRGRRVHKFIGASMGPVQPWIWGATFVFLPAVGSMTHVCWPYPTRLRKATTCPKKIQRWQSSYIFLSLSRPSMQAVSFDPFLLIQSPQPFLPYFSNITLTYFSLPINHVSPQLSTHWIKVLCYLRGGKTSNQEILFFFFFAIFYIRFIKKSKILLKRNY